MSAPAEVDALIQEPLRNLRSPNGQTLMTSGSVTYRGIFIDLISVRIVLNHITSRVPPVVKQLASQDMATDAPNT